MKNQKRGDTNPKTRAMEIDKSNDGWANFSNAMKLESNERCKQVGEDLKQYAAKNDLSFNQIKPWHFRLSGGNGPYERTIDFFPKSRQFYVVNTGSAWPTESPLKGRFRDHMVRVNKFFNPKPTE